MEGKSMWEAGNKCVAILGEARKKRFQIPRMGFVLRIEDIDLM